MNVKKAQRFISLSWIAQFRKATKGWDVLTSGVASRDSYMPRVGHLKKRVHSVQLSNRPEALAKRNPSLSGSTNSSIEARQLSLKNEDRRLKISAQITHG